MANQEQLDILKQGVNTWNIWREQHKEERPDLLKANLSDADLSYSNLKLANLRGADLSYSYLGYSYLNGANLSGTNLSGAELRGAYLNGANLNRANLSGADLVDAHLNRANLSGAELSGADLTEAILVRTNLVNSTLKDCSIYGISAWDVQLDGAVQLNLTITPIDQSIITVDNLKVAQFIYLLLNNAEIREVIDTIAKQAVLILGRFTPERKAILETLREALRTHGYLPILFDFEKPSSRSFTEIVRTLAHLARFIIADLTDPSSIPQELQAIIPTLAVPVQPVLLEGKREYSMFVDFRKTYHWVLPIHYYTDQANLITTVEEYVILPAEQKAQELEKR